MYSRSTTGAETPLIEDRILWTSLPIRYEDDPESRRTSMELRIISSPGQGVAIFTIEHWRLYNVLSVRCRTHAIRRCCGLKLGGRHLPTGCRNPSKKPAFNAGGIASTPRSLMCRHSACALAIRR